YLCASRAANTPGGRAMFVWHTDDGGRSFSAPLALVPQGVPELGHPAVATRTGPAPSQRTAHVVWAGGGPVPPPPRTRTAPPTPPAAPARSPAATPRPTTARRFGPRPRGWPPAHAAWCAPAAPRRPIRARRGTWSRR